jgi:hypothetical protein
MCLKVDAFITIINDMCMFGFAAQCYFLASQETGESKLQASNFHDWEAKIVVI